MGVFKSMRDLTHQAREVERSLPPVGDRVAAAQARMARSRFIRSSQPWCAVRQAAGCPPRDAAISGRLAGSYPNAATPLLTAANSSIDTPAIGSKSAPASAPTGCGPAARMAWAW